jgi:hypothetical protein
VTHFFHPRCSSWLLLFLAAVGLSGCMTRRTKLMEERSGLLRQRDQLQDPWQAPPQIAEDDKDKDSDKEAPLTPAERMKKLDQRVAEIDAKLMELKSSSISRDQR